MGASPLGQAVKAHRGGTHGWLKLFRMCKKGRFVMLGSGNTCNHPVYETNLVDGLLRAADLPEARGRTYLAGGVDVSV